MISKKDWEQIKEAIETFDRVEEIRNIIVLGEEGGVRNMERDDEDFRYQEETH